MTTPGRVTIDEQRSQDRLVLSVAGELDVHTAAPLRERLEAAVEDGIHEIVVDATEVTFMDSTGLGSILRPATLLQERSGRLVVAASPSVARVFALTHLDERIPVRATREDALAALD